MKKKEYKELLELGISELRFSNLCQEHLRSIIHEIENLTDDPTIQLIIKNGLERHNLDKCIHARKLFTSYK